MNYLQLRSFPLQENFHRAFVSLLINDVLVHHPQLLAKRLNRR